MITKVVKLIQAILSAREIARAEVVSWETEGVDNFHKVFGPRIFALEVTARIA